MSNLRHRFARQCAISNQWIYVYICSAINWYLQVAYTMAKASGAIVLTQPSQVDWHTGLLKRNDNWNNNIYISNSRMSLRLLKQYRQKCDNCKYSIGPSSVIRFHRFVSNREDNLIWIWLYPTGLDYNIVVHDLLRHFTRQVTLRSKHHLSWNWFDWT